eukprot:scaffold295_cov257-Pinguiococcus_pyrenoidosus.AAC.11
MTPIAPKFLRLSSRRELHRSGRTSGCLSHRPVPAVTADLLTFPFPLFGSSFFRSMVPKFKPIAPTSEGNALARSASPLRILGMVRWGDRRCDRRREHRRMCHVLGMIDLAGLLSSISAAEFGSGSSHARLRAAVPSCVCFQDASSVVLERAITSQIR